jgi:hypothetical protein
MFMNNLFMRTYPAQCQPNAPTVSHLLQTISITAWTDHIGTDYILVYLGHGKEFAEAVWVRKEATMLIYENENFTIPVYNYT